MSTEAFGMFDDPRVQACRDIYKLFACIPLPSDVFIKERWIMANAHYLICNALEAAYKNATHIDEGDLANYIFYSTNACLSLERHHQMEETLMFPRHEKRIKMNTNIDQHTTFLPGIQAAIAHLHAANPVGTATGTEPIAFSATIFRSHLDDVLLPMFQHLASELNTISPEIMRANFGDDEAYVRETQELVDEYLKKSDPLIFAPLAVYSAPRGYIFPEMPWVLKKVIVPVLSLRHYGIWKYCWQSRKWEE